MQKNVFFPGRGYDRGRADYSSSNNNLNKVVMKKKLDRKMDQMGY